ncbi:MAG: DNA translocase FtsK [Anaerolineae bacterium]|nr:DNA translocase FtsK [Anaerolineae bacterium]
MATQITSLLVNRPIKVISPQGAKTITPKKQVVAQTQTTARDLAKQDEAATRNGTAIGHSTDESEGASQQRNALVMPAPTTPQKLQLGAAKPANRQGVGSQTHGAQKSIAQIPASVKLPGYKQTGQAPAGRAIPLALIAERFVAACGALGFKVTGCDPKQAITGPRVHRLYFTLKSGERIDKLQKALPDIEREVGRSGLLIQAMPNSHAIALDCPNDKPDSVALTRGLKLIEQLNLGSDALPIPVGVSPEGRDVIVDLSDGPHMLIAGTTGAGKTSFIHGLLMALIQSHPDAKTLRLFLASSKLEDFSCFASLPHLEGGKCYSDPAEIIAKFEEYARRDFHDREALLVAAGCANGEEYNRGRNRTLPPMVPLVICIDEFADLADELDDQQSRKAFYKAVRKLAQAGRSKLIFLIIGTQRPSADLIPANLRDLLNARVALRCNSADASRMILNTSGAEKLLPKGDLLFQMNTQMHRLQGYFMPLEQIGRSLKRYIKSSEGR